MSERRTLPCFVVFENDGPEVAFFDEYAAQNEVASRKLEKKIDAQGNAPDGRFVYVHVHEIQIIDRRKERDE